MIITTTDSIEGHTISEYIGLVSAATVFPTPGGTKWMSKVAANITVDLSEALEKNAAAMHADAVVGLRFAMQGTSYVATGTAVKLK